jgi:adhesin transport system outer membrane protein
LSANTLSLREKRIILRSSVGAILLVLLSAKMAFAVTLKEACLESLTHSNILKSSKEMVVSAQSRVKSIGAERWPSINLTSDIGVTTPRPEAEERVKDQWHNSAGLELTWNIWDGGRRTSNELLEKLALTKSEHQAVLSANEVIQKTAEAYFGLHKALVAKRNHEEKIKLLKRQKSNIEEKVKNGLAAETGLMEIEGRIQQSEAIGLGLTRKLKSAQADLANVIGIDVVQGVRVSDLNELAVSELKTPPKMVWDDTPTAKMIALEDQSDQLKLRQLESKHGPQIDFTSNFSAGVRDVGVVEEHKPGDIFRQSSVGLSLKYNLFDGGQRRHEKSALVFAQKAQNLERDQKKREQRAIFDALYQDLSSFSAQSVADRKLLEMEKKRFEIVEREYRRGAQSYLDLVAALDALSLAQQAVDDDLIEEQLGLIRLHSMAGSIYGAIFE